MRESFVGTLFVRRGRRPRLVVRDEKGFEVDAAARQGLIAFPGDRVKVELISPAWTQGRRHARHVREAQIVSVLARGRSVLLGRYRANAKRAWVIPRDPGVVPMLEVAPRPGTPDGAVVAVELGPHPGVVKGEIAAVWEDGSAPRALIEQLVYERDLPREFPPAVLAEADACPDGVPREELERRLDCRDLNVVVIDPADARDHDDAVSWEPRPGGGGRLGVHIADVSWYVRPGSALDAEARARGVSVYLTDRVLPMLPQRLSADLCSLLEGRDRLARTVFLEFDAAGHPTGGEMRETVIRPAVSLSYEAAWAIMQDGSSPHPHAMALHAMDVLAKTLRARRFTHGSLDFQFPETKVVLGADGEPERVVSRLGDPSHWLIEEFMIAANTFAGERLTRQGAGIWRVHEPPALDDVLELEEFLRGLGIKLRHGPKSRDLRPQDFQAALEKVRGTPEEYVVHRKVLQALRLAVYAAENLGHFGLALTTYAHFTSPIRRYADLVVHRLTRPGPSTGLRAGGGDAVPVRRLAELAAQTSALERRAQEAEWACDKLMILRYLVRRLGAEFAGTVSRLERFGVFVTLDGMGTDGLIRMEELGGDRYWVAEDGMSMRGGRSGRTYRVGQRVRVVVARVSLEEGHLDLVPAGDAL